jgi:hypothetical protein
MHQRVMIGPTADAVEPGLEELEFGIAKLAVEFLEQEHGGYLFFQHRAGEKAIGDLDQKIESVLFFSPPDENGQRRGVSQPCTSRAI